MQSGYSKSSKGLRDMISQSRQSTGDTATKIASAKNKGGYGRKIMKENNEILDELDMIQKKHNKAYTKEPERDSIVLPDIGSEPETIS